MSTHNICFHREIRKILCGDPLLSVAMYKELVGSRDGKYFYSQNTGTLIFQFLTIVKIHLLTGAMRIVPIS